MSQSKYLFIGGPLDQQWRHIPPNLPVVTVMESPDPHGVQTSRMVNYYGVEIESVAWVVRIVVYRHDPLVTEPGTPLPGWVNGQRPDASPCGPWRYVDNHERYRGEAMHEAIKRSGYRP